MPLRSILPPRVHPAPPEIYRAAAPVFALAFAPDGKELAVGGYNEVTIWDAASGRLLRRIKGLPQRIHALAFNRAGDQLLVGGGVPGEYGELSLVDPGSAPKIRTFGNIRGRGPGGGVQPRRPARRRRLCRPLGARVS